MKKLSLIISACLLLSSCDLLFGPIGPDPIVSPKEEDEEKEPEENEVSPSGNTFGWVKCGEQGLEGVVVSDGFVVTTTNSEGYYEFNSNKKHGYAFISIPSGYEVDYDGVLPQFFKYYTEPADSLEEMSFNLTQVNQDKYNIFFLGDMHLAARSTFHDIRSFKEFTYDVVDQIASLDNKTYAITLGDMSWDYFWRVNNYDLTDYLNEVNSDFEDNLPIFHTMGNHDNDSAYEGDFKAESTYKKIIGPTYYSFNIGGIHYIVLDDIEYRNYVINGSKRDYYRDIPKDQADWLIEDLKYVDKSTPLVLTMHSPLYYNNGDICLYNGYQSLIKYLSGYKSTFVTGHTHVVYNVDRTSSPVSVYESNSGAVCGAWWVSYANSGINLSTDGSPAGYRIMEVDGSNFKWDYKATGCPRDYKFRSYDRNELWLTPELWTPNATNSGKAKFKETVGEYGTKSSDNEVLLNVWDYDPSWKIVVKEDGKALKVTQLDDVMDPLYLVCYEAYEYEHHYDNSISYPCGVTDHIFSVKASSPNSTLEIEVTDRYGVTYTETMKRPKAFKIENYRY